LSNKYRVFSTEFKQEVVQRILKGESVNALHLELRIKRSVLYRWRDAFQEGGAGGLRPRHGRPPVVLSPPQGEANVEAVDAEDAARQIRELERKIGQQAMDIDFLRRAFKRVKDSRPNNTEGGAKASTPRSEV
jgi:transposase